MPEHLNVCIRVRPLLGEREEADGSCIFLHEDQRTVEVEGNRAFSFDSAFGPRTSQNEMFAACGVRDLMEKLLDGVNCSLIVCE